MSTLPTQLDLYYSISRGRIGLPRLKEILEKEKYTINGALPGLVPAAVQAVISMDDEIFQMLLDNGADIEITPGKATKLEMPKISDDAFSAGKELGKKVAGNALYNIVRNISILRDLTRGKIRTQNTSVGSQIRETMSTRERVQQFIENEQNAWRKIGGEYFEDLTPFAVAVFRKDKRVIDRLLESYNVNPNPVLKGKLLSEILLEQDREHLSKRLEMEAEKYKVTV